jgi:hypothetical protein
MYATMFCPCDDPEGDSLVFMRRADVEGSCENKCPNPLWPEVHPVGGRSRSIRQNTDSAPATFKVDGAMTLQHPESLMNRRLTRIPGECHVE